MPASILSRVAAAPGSTARWTCRHDVEAFVENISRQSYTRVNIKFISSKCDLVVTQDGTMPVLQQLNVAANKTFKSNFGQKYIQSVHILNQKKMPMHKVQKASLSTIAAWISDAWKQVKGDDVAK